MSLKLTATVSEDFQCKEQRNVTVADCHSYLDLIDERPLREDLGLQQLVLQRGRPLGHLRQPREVPLDVGLLENKHIIQVNIINAVQTQPVSQQSM